MSINRRQFNRMALLGGASVVASTGVFFPKPVEAFSLKFALKNLSAGRVFNDILHHTAAQLITGLLYPLLQGDSNFEERMTPERASGIREADGELVDHGFINNRTELLQVGENHTSSLIWGRQRQDKLGENVGFGFSESNDDTYIPSKITGPHMVGLHQAMPILKDRGFSSEEIADSLFPIRSQQDAWSGWDGDSAPSVGLPPTVDLANYRTVRGEVTSRYELVKPGKNGFGEVQINIDGIKPVEIIITVKFG
jgi:hypothetical protein